MDICENNNQTIVILDSEQQGLDIQKLYGAYRYGIGLFGSYEAFNISVGNRFQRVV